MKTEIIPAKDGKKEIKFKVGGLHESLNVPQGHKIPKSKLNAALEGDKGALAKKRALFAKNVLTGKK